jgi:UDP-glucose 4-epimerase
MKILVTGICGYIGSITSQLLLHQGHEIIGVDNLSTGFKQNLSKDIEFHQIDVNDHEKLTPLIKNTDAVIHFAAKTSVAESVNFPNLYYSNNVEGSKSLLKAMRNSNTRKLIFSSSASVYGAQGIFPIKENDLCTPINPYGMTKLETENNISTFCQQGNSGAVSLRYFNVAGALKVSKTWLRERHDPETHLVPNILNSNKENPLKIYGTNFDTPDGTCIRDYVHVVDIARAHILALENVVVGENQIVNIGSGKGNSVLEVFKTAEKVISRNVPVDFVERREGDPDRLVADIRKAKEVLNWEPELTLLDMIRDAYQAITEDSPK